MTDKIDDILASLNDYSGIAEGFVKNINTDIKSLNESIKVENNKIDEELRRFKPIGDVIPVSSGGNYKKEFLSPHQLRNTYKNIKMTGGSKQDINNMIYTIEKMQKMGINRNFFPSLLQKLKNN